MREIREEESGISIILQYHLGQKPLPDDRG
jgi:hypothetical protein